MTHALPHRRIAATGRAATAAERRGAAEDIMANLLQDFTVYVTGTERNLHRAGRYRANLLWVHSLAALLIAPLFNATGRDGIQGPAWVLVREIHGTPTSLAALIGLGGFVLGVGAILGNRRIEATGLILLAAFYAILAVSFTGAVVLYLTGGMQGKPALYSPVLYLHLTIIMAVHMAGRLRASNDDDPDGDGT